MKIIIIYLDKKNNFDYKIIQGSLRDVLNEILFLKPNIIMEVFEIYEPKN